MFNNKNKSRGFTLIETFVAITVLMIAVLGPMTLLSKALQDSAYIRDEIIATFLAQEGVELMMHNRNNESGSLLSPSPKVFDYSCDKFYLSEQDGYNCSVGDLTNFSRVVSVELLPTSGYEYKIISTVGRAHGQSVVSSGIIFKAPES